jgi:ABC-type multidrug transport system ATPase subunit
MNMNFVLVSDLRREYSKNNTFAVNHIKFNIVYETVFGLLDPNASRH